MRINLLPKKPWLIRYRVAIGVLLIVFHCTGLSLVFRSAMAAGMEVGQLRNRADDLQIAVAHLIQQTRKDPQAAKEEALAKEITNRRSESRDWSPVWEALVQELPAHSRMVSMTLEQEASVKEELVFLQLSDAAEYISRLEESPLFAGVQLQELQRTDRDPVYLSAAYRVSAAYRAQLTVALKPAASAR